MNSVSFPAAAAAAPVPSFWTQEKTPALRYLILRAHPGRSRADFYNCQELGLAAFLKRQGIRVGVGAVFDDDVRTLDPALRIHQLRFWRGNPAFALMSNPSSLDLPGYDIVQLSDLCLPGNLQVILRAQKKTRFLLYQGHYPEPLGRGRWLRVWQSRAAALALRSRPHAVLAKSTAAAKFVGRCGLGRAPVAGVGLVAENLLRPAPPPPDVTAFVERSRFTFLYVGQLNERRPLRWVMPHLRDPTLAHASLLVVGRGTALARVRAEGADLVAAGRLKFAGNLNQSQLGALYRQVDALVLPTRFEIFGMVCLEGVLFGLPVIASDVSGPAAVASRFPDKIELIEGGRNPARWQVALAAAAQRPPRRQAVEPDPDLVHALSWETPGRHFINAIEQLAATGSTRHD